jgi:diguanylate cyclase (GGDEF)-like protein
MSYLTGVELKPDTIQHIHGREIEHQGKVDQKIKGYGIVSRFAKIPGIHGALNRIARHDVAKDLRIERLRKNKHVDYLTGLQTKSFFNTTLNQEIASVERDRRTFPLELTEIDIDDFGTFNKQYGNPTGDEVLRMVGTTINGTLRASDSAFRIGGEEIALISRKTHNPEKSGDKLISERHLDAIRNARSENGHTVTVSVGQTDYIREEGKKIFEDRANTALIMAKRLGKNRVVVGEVIEKEEVYTDMSTGKRYHALKDTDGKFLEPIEINNNG